MQTKYFSATVYAKQGESKRYPDGSVGITFAPTPGMRVSELYQLADELIALAKSMRE